MQSTMCARTAALALLCLLLLASSILIVAGQGASALRLRRLARAGDATAIKALLGTMGPGFDINQMDHRGRTAIHNALEV